YLRWRQRDNFAPGPWTLGRHYRWVNPGALLFAVVCVIALDLPFTHAAVPWNSGFDATALKYTPGALVVALLVGVWCKLSATNEYTGPVRTLDTDERGRVIEEPVTTPPTRPA